MKKFYKNLTAMAAVGTIGSCGAFGSAYAATNVSATSSATLTSSQNSSNSSSGVSFTTPVYEATNPTTGATFLSTSAHEVSGASAFGFTVNNGAIFNASSTAQSGLIAVHRLYNPTYGFVYIPEGAELNKAVSSYGYKDEKIEFYASKTSVNNTVPVYRLATPENHFVFTTDELTKEQDLAKTGWKEGFAAFYVGSSWVPKISADNANSGQATTSATTGWGSWMNTSNQGDARNHIQFGITSPVVQQSDVGKTVTFWAEGDPTAPVDGSVYDVGYFNNTGQWTGVGSEQHSTNGDVAIVSTTITQDMVGKTIDSGGRETVVTDTVNHQIRGQVWIGGDDKGTFMQTVQEPMAAPAAPTDGVPLQARAAGYTTKKFNTDFSTLNAVDLTGKGDSSKQWFTDRTWSNALPSKDLSVVDNATKISPETNDGPNYDIASVSKAGQTGENFKYGYFQARLKFDPSITTTPQLTDATGKTTQVGGWPSWWLYEADALKTGNVPESGEIDGLEYFNNANYGGLHRYTGSVWDHTNGVNTSSGGASDMEFPTDKTQSDWNTYGILWKPGFIQWDIDGLVSKTLTYGKNVHPSINGVVQTQLPVGMFSHLDDSTNGVGMVLGTGAGDPLSVSNVQVWQAQ